MPAGRSARLMAVVPASAVEFTVKSRLAIVPVPTAEGVRIIRADPQIAWGDEVAADYPTLGYRPEAAIIYVVSGYFEFTGVKVHVKACRVDACAGLDIDVDRNIDRPAWRSRNSKRDAELRINGQGLRRGINTDRQIRNFRPGNVDNTFA